MADEKKPLSYYRKLIKHKKKTPAEPRYMMEDILEDIEYYPLQDVYCVYRKIGTLPLVSIQENQLVEEKWFYERLTDQRIIYAIQYLQVAALNRFIIRNHKSIMITNPFYELFNILYPIKLNTSAFQEIIRILIDNYDDHIVLISRCTRDDQNKYIFDLIYSSFPNDPLNCCVFCHRTQPINELINPCQSKQSKQCTARIHIDCLVEMIKNKNNKCKLCLSDYKRNVPCWVGKTELDKTIYFPENDIYYQPLISSTKLFRVTGMSRLDFAIIYLQIERVRELLQDTEIINGLSDHFLGYRGYRQTPIIALCSGYVGNNCNIKFGDNITKYMQIISLLLNTQKIDLQHRDAFGKNYMDYIEDGQYTILKNIFK